MICHKLDAGIGYSRGNPICVPPKVVPYALELIHDYLRFYEDFNEDPDRSDEVRCLFVLVMGFVD